jgi:hypothetical protein
MHVILLLLGPAAHHIILKRYRSLASQTGWLAPRCLHASSRSLQGSHIALCVVYAPQLTGAVLSLHMSASVV